MRKLVFTNFQAPGDVVMLTAAVRDLHLCYPGRFVTDVRTHHPAIWENNPLLSSLDENERDVETIHCEYPLIHSSNQSPYHFLHGFIRFLNDRLGLDIQPSNFKGDIHLSQTERTALSPTQLLLGKDIPYWLVVAGGKNDFTIKWWDTARYQSIVNHFLGKIHFIQAGAKEHHHRPLNNVTDLTGRTSLRQFIRLVYHSQGVLCPVTLAMHLAAAIEPSDKRMKNRPCVVVAGGREPPQWEAYPHHQFIHTVGALRCCDNGGCWKSRTLPLGDGADSDRPENLCVDVIGALPRCMDMISADDVISRIEMYFEGDAFHYL